ncbi:MAG TPA: ATP-binding protein, partial [Tissierellaceae bacterium]
LKGSHIVRSGSEVYKIKHAPFKNKDELESFGGLIIVFQDITKEHELDNMRKEFVANVSHELKTPITTIKSYTETLLESEVDKEIENKFLNIINEESDRMNRLVSDLLKLSNLDYKKTKWNKSLVDINSLIEDCLLKLDFSSKEKNQEIIVKLNKNIEKLYIDKDAIQQVLLNILTNAIKYNDHNGLIEVKSTEEEKEIIISIKDNGPGISKEDLDRIFERFYRVEKGRSRELGGTGLGLSIAKEIVEAHGGSLKLTSELSKGTRVDIILPKDI